MGNRLLVGVLVRSRVAAEGPPEPAIRRRSLRMSICSVTRLWTAAGWGRWLKRTTPVSPPTSTSSEPVWTIRSTKVCR